MLTMSLLYCVNIHVLLSVVTLFCSTFTQVTNGCGGFFCTPNQPVIQSGEAIVFAVNAQTGAVEMHVQIDYSGEAEDFSWLLPMPIQPEISVGSDVLFTSLFENTRPQFNFVIHNDATTTCSADLLQTVACATMVDESTDSAAESSATVLEQGSVGPFDFVIVTVAEDGEPDTIFQWLGENGYDQPKVAEPLVNYYAGMGMVFVALRLRKESSVGEIRPVVLKYSLPNTEGAVSHRQRTIYRMLRADDFCFVDDLGMCANQINIHRSHNKHACTGVCVG